MARERTTRQPGDDDVPFPPHISTPPAAEYCAWRTHNRRCLMLATLWLTPAGNYEFNQYGQVTKVLKPGYCAWHHACLSSPRLQDNFDEFERLYTYWLKRPYCNQFVHHPASYVWTALRGVDRAPADRITVTPCNAADCYVPELLTPESARPSLSATEARRRIGEIITALTTRMSSPV